MQDDWIELGTRRDITFTDLDPGAFTLEVRGRNDQGVWADMPVGLAIQVIPPFWMTPWFRFLLLLAGGGAVLGIHRWRTAALEEQNRTLQTLKDQREQALQAVQANEQALHQTYDKLRRLTSRLEAAKEDERKRIARELHDEMGQALTTAKINLELMNGIRSGEELDQRIADTISLMDLMIGQVRALSLDLRPPLLDELGLIPALKGYLEVQSMRSGLPIGVRTDDVPPGLPPEIEILAFRVVQEAVTNVLRHSSASEVQVKVGYEPGWLAVSVRDDGCGFDVDATLEKASAGKHLGLLGIRERVESNGGVVRIQSSPGNGTSILIDVPLESVREPHASHPG
jgi:signal transduction histidine kinase